MIYIIVILILYFCADKFIDFFKNNNLSEDQKIEIADAFMKGFENTQNEDLENRINDLENELNDLKNRK